MQVTGNEPQIYLTDLFADVSNPVTDIFDAFKFAGTTVVSTFSFGAQAGGFQLYKVALKALKIECVLTEDIKLLEEKTGSPLFGEFLLSLSTYLTELSKRKLVTIEGTVCDPLLHMIGNEPKLGELLPKVLLRAGVNLAHHTAKKMGKSSVDLTDILLCLLEEFQADFEKVHKCSPLEREKAIEELSQKLIKRLLPKGAEELPLVDLFGFGFELAKTKLVPLWISSLYEVVIELFGNECSKELKSLEGGETLYLIAKRVGELSGQENGPSLASDFKEKIGDLVVDFFEPGQEKKELSAYIASQVDKLARIDNEVTKNIFSFGSEMITRLSIDAMTSLVKGSQGSAVSVFFKKVKAALEGFSGKEVFERLLKDISLGEGHLLTQAPALKTKIVPEFIDSYTNDVKNPLKKGARFLPLAKPLADYLKRLLKAEDRALATTLCHLFSAEFTKESVDALLLGLDLDDPVVEEYFEKAIASFIAQVVEGFKQKSFFVMLEEIADAFFENGQEGVASKVKEMFVAANLKPSGIPLPSPQLQKLAFEAMRDRVIPDFLTEHLKVRAPLLKQICLRLNWDGESSFKAVLGQEGRFLFNTFDELICEYKSPKVLASWLGVSETALQEILEIPFYEKLFNQTIETFFYYSLSHMVGEDHNDLLVSLFKKVTEPFRASTESDKIYDALLQWMNLSDLFETEELKSFGQFCRLFFNESYVAFSGNSSEYLLAKKAFVDLLEDKDAPIPLSGNVTLKDLEKAQEAYLLRRQELVERIEKPLGTFAAKIVEEPLANWLKSYDGEIEAQTFLKKFSPKSKEKYQQTLFSWITEEIKKTLFIGFLGLAETVREERGFKLETLPSQVIDWIVLCWDKHQKNVSFETIYKLDALEGKELDKAKRKVYGELAPFSKELIEGAFKKHGKALPFPKELIDKVFKWLEEEGLPALLVDHIRSLHGNLKEKEKLQVDIRSVFGTNYLNEMARVLGIYAKQALQEYLKGQSKLLFKEFPKEFSVKIDDALPGFSLAWGFIEDRLENSLLEMIYGFSKGIEAKEGARKEKGLFLKELLKEFLTSSEKHFKAFNDTTISHKKASASQISREVFLEGLAKRGVAHKAKEAADALETLLRETFKKPKIEYFQLPQHTYLEKYPSFCAHFEQTPDSKDGKFKQWKLKDKKISELVCKEAASIALTEEFFVPLTDTLFKMSGCDDLSRFPGQKEIGDKTYLFLKESVLPGLLKSVFDSLMDPATLHSLMDQSLQLIKSVECVAEQEQIKENFKTFKGVIDLMNEALDSGEPSKMIERQIKALEECHAKFRAVNHALPGTVVFIHLEGIALRAKSFVAALKEPLKTDEVNSARTALLKSLSDALEKLYTKPAVDDDESIKEFNETCGHLVLEIISFIPHVLTKPILETENIQQFSKEAIGKAILEKLNEESWTVLKGLNKGAEKVLPTVHEGKFEGEAHTAKFQPQRSRGFNFYSGIPTEGEKASAAAEVHKKVVNDIAKTVYDQVIQTLSRSFKYHWDRFQKEIDEYIDKKFGENGVKIKKYLDKQFDLVFVKGFGAFLSFFFYHLFLPIFWLIDLYNKARVRDFIKNGEHDGHKHLVLNLMDLFFKRVAA